MPRVIEPPEELRIQVVNCIRSDGIAAAAARYGLGRTALTRIAAGLPVTPGSLALVSLRTAQPALPEPVPEKPRPVAKPRARRTQASALGSDAPSVLVRETPDLKMLNGATLQEFQEFLMGVARPMAPRMPWRIRVEARGDEVTCLLDFSGCAAVWGIAEDDARANNEELGVVPLDVATDRGCWIEQDASPLVRLARYAAKRVTEACELYTPAPRKKRQTSEALHSQDLQTDPSG